MPHSCIYRSLCRASWKELLLLSNCKLGVGDKRLADCYTLAAVYTKALAAFHELGGDHPTAQAALAAALERDRWGGSLDVSAGMQLVCWCASRVLAT